MKKLKHVCQVLIVVVLCLSFVLVVGCGKNNPPSSTPSSSQAEISSNSQTPTSVQPSYSVDTSISHNPTNSDSFDYSKPNQSVTTSKEEPQISIQAQMPLVYAVYKLGDLDGSYNGTNAEIGFPKPISRVGESFTTYPVGYGEGTTGGRGASADNVYECSTGLEILSALDQIKQKQAVNAELKSIIKVTATITQENTTAQGATSLVYQIVPNSINNVTFIGANQNAIFDGVGINFKSCNNVIVQNLTIHHPSKILKNEKDCLEFNKCNYVWVDHCELYNDAPTSSSEKDYYDGLIDVKNESSHVTISYNYIHDAWKTSLVGSGPDDLCETRTITYHHNIFENVNSRVPAIRSGYGHIYNNYYKDIKSSGANCRIEADVYIEDNIFENCKKPICADEDAIKGFYNISSGNVFTNCSNVPSSSTTDFTPSYQYVLDGTTNLKTYLNSTVGVNKIDVAVQCANDEGYNREYVVDKNLIIDREINEIGEVKLDNATLQKLVYVAQEILFADALTLSKLQNLSKFETAVSSYITLFATDLNNRILAINLNGDFAENATNLLKAVADYNRCEEIIKSQISQSAKLMQLQSEFEQNVVSLFNAQIQNLQSVSASDMPTIEKLIVLYEGLDSSKQALIDYQGLQKAYVYSKADVIANEFEILCDSLPQVEQISHSHSTAILTAIEKYKDLTATQISLVEKSAMDKFAVVYNYVKTQTRSMNVSKITDKKVASTSVSAGDVDLSKNMEVLHDGTQSYQGKTYVDYAYISGYGNRGTKSIWFTVYSNSSVEVVLNTIDAKGKLIIANTDGVVIKTLTTESANLCKLTITDLQPGEYRFYTSMPDETYTATKAYVYEFNIKPIN